MFLRRAFLDYLRYTGCIQSQQSIKIGHLEGPQNLRGPVFYHIFVCTCLKIGFGSTTKKIYQFSWFRPQTVCVCMWGRWGARGLASTGVYYPQPGPNQVSMCRLALKGILPWAVGLYSVLSSQDPIPYALGSMTHNHVYFLLWAM